MIWGAHKADGRLAAKNAIKIRAALGQQLDPAKVYRRYLETQPIATDNLSRDRSRAKSWAMLNVGLNMNALYTALVRLWTEAYVMGDLAAREAVLRAREAKKANDGAYIDWDNWTPGDEVTAALARPPAALERLITEGKARVKEFNTETYNQLGTALADSIALGLTGSQSAKLINNIVRSPARALTIAITETARVASYSAMQTYKEYGLEKQEWQASSPCDKCAVNEGAVVEIGSPFPSGVTQPPQHPHCRCALLPVIPDITTNEHGVNDILPSNKPAQFTEEKAMFSFAQTQQGAIARTELAQRSISIYQSDEYVVINDALRNKTPLSEGNALVKNIVDSAIKRSSFDTDVLVYRGLADETGAITSLGIGSEVRDLAYTSTSMNPAVAEAFANGVMLDRGQPVVMEILIPKGSPALAADVVTNPTGAAALSAQDAEMYGYSNLNEVVLPRGTTLKITGRRIKDKTIYLEMTVITK